MTESTPDIVAVVSDLYFQSRVAAAARAAGRTVRFAGSAAALERIESCGVALVDLDAGPFVLEAIGRLKGVCAGPIIAFGPHVDTELRRAARAAGAGRVLAKSKFATELPRIVARE